MLQDLPVVVRRVLIGLPADGIEDPTEDKIRAFLGALRQHVHGVAASEVRLENVVFEQADLPPPGDNGPLRALESQPLNLVQLVCQASAPARGLQVGVDERQLRAAAAADGIVLEFEGGAARVEQAETELAAMERQIEACRARLDQYERRASELRALLAQQPIQQGPGRQQHPVQQQAPVHQQSGRKRALKDAPIEPVAKRRRPGPAREEVTRAGGSGFVPPREGEGWSSSVIERARRLTQVEMEDVAWIRPGRKGLPGMKRLAGGIRVKSTGQCFFA